MGKSGIGKARRARLNVLREAALHRDTVARRLPEGFNGRWTRRQWAHASLFATLAALVAAIVPGFSPIAQPGVPTAARKRSEPIAWIQTRYPGASRTHSVSSCEPENTVSCSTTTASSSAAITAVPASQRRRR